MSSIAARVVDTHASAQQAVGHLLGQRAALPHNFDSFTAVQVHDHFLQHGVECTLDFAAQAQRDFIAHKLEHGELRASVDTDDKQAQTTIQGHNGSNGHRPSLDQAASPRPPRTRPHPAHYQAHGRLFRAIVSLPESMCERDRPLQERWVFFDCPTAAQPGSRLEALLALAWNIATTGWCDRGFIYNVAEASQLIARGDADDDTALFECEWGSEGTKHVPLQDVDFFCTPRVRARLELALMQAHVGAAMKGGKA